jgi:hypothetical protein
MIVATANNPEGSDVRHLGPTFEAMTIQRVPHRFHRSKTATLPPRIPPTAARLWKNEVEHPDVRSEEHEDSPS